MGYKGKKSKVVCFQIFSSSRPRCGRISGAIAPHSAVSHRQGSSAVSPGSRASREHGGGGRVHCGASVPFQRSSNQYEFCLLESKSPSNSPAAAPSGGSRRPDVRQASATGDSQMCAALWTYSIISVCSSKLHRS